MPQLRDVQPSSTTGPNTHNQIGPQAKAVCVKLCRLDKSLATHFFWVSCLSHCFATLDLRAGVEQPFNYLIAQNHQAMQSMGKTMDWTLENNMVDDLFFFATLTGRRGGHTPFVQAGTKMSDTGAAAVKPDTGSSWEGQSMGTSVKDKNVESCGAVHPLCIPLVIRPLRRMYVVVVRWTDEMLCNGYKWV